MGKKNSNTVSVGKKMGKLEWQARFVVGKLRRGASSTRNDQLNCLGKIGNAMQRFGLNSIKDIKPAHVERYFAELKTAGLSAGRMANHATAMRMLCNIMGKGIVPSNAALGCARSIAHRTKHSDERLDNAKYDEAMTKLSANNQIAYTMARCFGLRQKETLQSHRTVTVDGIARLVVEGAKGGRPRSIAIVTPEQKAALSANLTYRATRGGLLIDEDKSLKQGIRQLQNELAAAGASRSSGANMHALRREWIIEQCQQILKVPEAERAQMIESLIESIGHGRVEVIRAYTSLLEDPPEE